MTDEIKTETTETVVVVAEPNTIPSVKKEVANTTNTMPTANAMPSAKNESSRRGERGEVGPHHIKGLFHAFQRREKRHAKGVSLKAFAHKTAEEGTDEDKVIVLDWIANKAGALVKKQKAERLKVRGSTIKATALATKQAKHGKK